MTGFGIIKVPNGTIEYLAITAYSIEVAFKTTTVLENTDDSGNIVSIISGDYTSDISINKILTLNYGDITSEFRIYRILKISPHRYKLYTHIPNKTRHFLVPMLRYKKEDWLYECLINAYISKDNNFIHLHYRFSTAPIYLKFENDVKKRLGFFSKKDIDKNSVVYIFKIPDIFKRDIEVFKLGKYSFFSDLLKSQIISFYNYTYDSTTAKILRRDDQYRKQLELDFGVSIKPSLDLYDIPSFDDEFKNIEEIC